MSAAPASTGSTTRRLPAESGWLSRAVSSVPAETPKAQVIDVLKEMRDDLRLVIDSTAQEQADLALLLAPLRHRASRLLETADIDAHWHVEGLDGVQLEPARSLDLLRLLQEALTNVFKHSRAQRVDVAVIQRDGRLQVRVQDDGVGLHAASGVGAGLASLRVRALRLGGPLQVETPPGGGTRVSLEIALA